MSEALAPERLKDISPRAFQHPADRAATAALQSIPMLDPVVRKLIEMNYERAFRQSLMAASVRIGPNQLPHIHKLWERALARLDMNDDYALYVTQEPVANAVAIGADKPLVLLPSRTVELLDEEEMLTVLAHEAGHILSDHVLYRTALMILLRLSAAARLPITAGIPLLAIQTALLEWARATEYSCDRAATLVNHDPLVTCRLLMVVSAGLPSNQLDLNAYLTQAADYATWDSAWDRISRIVAQMQMTHSYPVRRTAEVRAWVESGEYNRIVDGGYQRRGEPADPRNEASDAVKFYSDRFKSVFSEAGEQVSKSGSRLAEWLRGSGNGGDSE
jgi:Zn-dependent protease with chaperone function